MNVGEYDIAEKGDCLPGGVSCLRPNQIIPVQEFTHYVLYISNC